MNWDEINELAVDRAKSELAELHKLEFQRMVARNKALIQEQEDFKEQQERINK